MFMSTFIIFSILASWSSFSALSDICAATSSSNIIMDTTKERIFSRLLKRARGVKARTLLLGVSQLPFSSLNSTRLFLPTNYPLLSSFFWAVRPTLGGDETPPAGSSSFREKKTLNLW